MKKRYIWITALLCLCLAFGSTASTGAYLFQASGTDSTQLIAPVVNSEIVYVGGSSATEGARFWNAGVKNTGNVPVYARALYALNYTYIGLKENAQAMIYSAQPPIYGGKDGVVTTFRNGTTRTSDYVLTTNSEWKPGSDGYYYYTTPLQPNASSTDLIKDFGLWNNQLVWGGQTYYLTGEVFFEVIQCETTPTVGDPAVVQAWGVTLANGAGSNITAAP